MLHHMMRRRWDESGLQKWLPDGLPGVFHLIWMSFEFDLNLGTMNVGMFEHQQEVFNLNKFRSSISQWNTDSSQSYLTVDITVNNNNYSKVSGGIYGRICRYTTALFRKLSSWVYTWGRDKVVEQAMVRWCAYTIDRARQKSESGKTRTMIKNQRDYD